jgi:predicted dehydrogenase
MKNINILFFGLGSIGQRHVKNLHLILGEKVNFYTYRERNKNVFSKNIKDLKDEIENRYNIKVLDNLKKIKDYEIDIIFITNPSSMHLKTAIKLKDYKNKYLFIEKPLDANLKYLKKFEKLIKENKLKTYIGYNLKFHACVQKIKKIISKKNYLHKIINAEFYYGDSLKNWHKHEDYKLSYAAKKKLGGGIILSSIHEYDLMYEFFGNAKFIKSYNDHLSSLKIDVEDFSISIFENRYRNNKIISVISLNYFQENKERYIKMNFENGSIFADLINYKITISKNKKIKKFIFQKNNNLMYLNELKHFIDIYKHSKKISSKFNYINGLNSLKLALQVKNLT